MTKITLENEYGTYTIESKENLETIYDHYEQLIKPLLIAASFSEKLVIETFEGYVGIENIQNDKDKRINDAIKHIKSVQVNLGQYEYLMLGDVATVIEILTENEIDWKDLIYKKV